MQIKHDHSYVSQSAREFISRGYACESLYSLRFGYTLTEAQQAENRAYAEQFGMDSDAWISRATDSARRHSEHMGRVADVLAQNLTVCQYDDSRDISYESDWDLFFWCNDFSSTMRGLLSGRDYSYFTLTFNSKHDHERRQKVYHRVMRILDLFAGDENLHVAVQYTALMNDTRIKHDAAIAVPRLSGRTCTYSGMEGRIESSGEGLCFRKKRSRKYICRLTDTEILSLSWLLLTHDDAEKEVDDQSERISSSSPEAATGSTAIGTA